VSAAGEARSAVRGLTVDEASGATARAGVRAGDRIVAIDGRAPEDVLDLTLAAADGRFTLELQRGDLRFTKHVALRRAEQHGLSLRDGLGVPVRGCANDCTFCFVDQLPPGLRPSLYVRDDDYRLSFLQGTFITLTNLDEHDLERIAGLRLSPLYVSLHAWDDGVRARLMGAGAVRARPRLAWLAGHGIEVHVQVVLCPGVNDGAVLRETIEQLAALAGGPACVAVDGGPVDDGGVAARGRAATRGGVMDVGVVPVSLLHESRGLRRVTPGDAATALTLVSELQGALLGRLGRRFVHAADELYLQTGVLPPAGDAPAQYENGIGICAALLADAEALEISAGGPRLALLGGTASAPVLTAAACGLVARGARAVRPYVVANRLFGPHVTVTGLLGGREVLAALREQPLAAGEWQLAPRVWLPADLSRTLDDVTEAELAAACGGRLALGDDLADAVLAVR
jgi:putative radical SAM enzyme (TIGR03279 family)